MFEKIKKNIFAILNIIIPILLFVILLFSDLSENFMYIMTLTIVIGWIIPYFVLLITGICIFNKSHHKLCLTNNIINIILVALLIFLISSIYDSKMLLVLIEYIIIGIISIINICYYYK